MDDREHLIQSAYERALEYARATGTDDGEAAASWYFDGNTPEPQYRAVLDGIESGDPAVLDTFPSADLSGQWAGTLTGPALVDDAIDAPELTEEERDTLAQDAFADVCDAYESAYADAVTVEIERAARAYLLR